jgi:hypothetical protein
MRNVNQPARHNPRIWYALVAIAALAGIALVALAVVSSRKAPTGSSGALFAPSASQPASGAVADTSASAASVTPAPSATATAAAPGAAGSQGANPGSASKPSPAKKPLPGKPPVELSSVPTGTIAFLSGVSGTKPQTYLVVADVLGWQKKATGVAVFKVISARLLGAVDPITGLEKSKPAAGATDNSAALRSTTFLAATSRRARSSLTTDIHELNVVLIPGMGGSTLVIDRVVR